MFTRRGPLIFLFLALLLIGFGVYVFNSPAQLNGAVIEPPKQMPGFTLTSSQGAVSLGDFRGKLVVLFFGYTSCPDICPLTLANLRLAMEKIGGKAQDVQVLFVSVDPGRDTPEKLTGYVQAFRPDFLGLTAAQAEIYSVTSDFGIYYKINEPDAKGYYSVEHTASTLVLDRQGRLVLTWPNGTTPDDIAADLITLLKRP